MRPITGNNLLMMERAVGGLWSRQRAILDNIVNAETPGYKAKYVTFEEELRSRLRGARSGALTPASIRDAIDDMRPSERVFEQETTRMDDNGVNVTEQNVELARNALEMQYAIQSIGTELATLRSAIRGQ